MAETKTVKDLRFENHQLAIVRNKLQADKVKLWLPPYFENSATNPTAIKELIEKYKETLFMDKLTLAHILENLQNNALEKLAARDKFQSSGIATLKIKFVGEASNVQESVEISLLQMTRELKDNISLLHHVDYHKRIKLISHGKVMKDDSSLASQGLTNGSVVLAVVLPGCEESQQVEEAVVREVEAIKSDADLLSSKEDDSEDYLRITDQNGKLIKLPREEKKSLAVAMALHEKGRAAIKRNEYSFALTLLHEADLMFSQCRSELLDVVDNYALLNLDIAWCYLLLGSAADMHDAVSRLEKCEKSLEKSYGANMERVLNLKGTTGSEAVLFVRLHLLQGVVAFHQGKMDEARRILKLTEQEIKTLTVNDGDLSELVALGFTVTEARLGLRAAGNRLSEACAFLQRRREEKEKIRNEEKEEKKRMKERKQLGKTADGQWVNLGFHKTMISMGYPPTAAAEALKQTNNNITSAIENLQQNPHLFEKEDLINEEKLAQVVSLGFAMEAAEKALKKHRGNVASAVEDLAANMGHISDEEVKAESSEAKRRKEESAAYERLASDLPETEDDYLDLSLELETSYLRQYLAYFH